MYMNRKRVSGRRKYTIDLKEINRLKSNCSATSSINALLIVYYLPYLPL